MANPTTNYGFVLPTSSDLVTDLPADFDIALQGVDTRLKALQPGTTLGDLAYSSATANTNTRLPIGTTGQVLSVSGGVPAWAKAPNFTGSVVNSNQGQSISTATQTAVTFNLEVIDTDAFHSTVSNTSRFTIPAGLAGKYRVGGAARFPQNATGRRFAQILASTGTAKTFESSANASAFLTVSGSAIFSLAVADYVEFQVYQDSGSSLSLVTNTDSVFFEIEYLGA